MDPKEINLIVCIYNSSYKRQTKIPGSYSMGILLSPEKPGLFLRFVKE